MPVVGGGFAAIVCGVRGIADVSPPGSDPTPPNPREGFGVHGRGKMGGNGQRGGVLTRGCPARRTAAGASRLPAGTGGAARSSPSVCLQEEQGVSALPGAPSSGGHPSVALSPCQPRVPRTVDLQLLRGRPLGVLQGLVVHRAGHLGIVVLLGDAELHPTADGEGLPVGVLHHLRALGCGGQGTIGGDGHSVPAEGRGWHVS